MSEHKNDADIQQMDTYTLESMLANVQNLEEYEAIMQQAQSQNGIWKQQITAVMVEKNLTKDRFAKLVAEGCNVSRATAYSLASKAPAKRENVLGIAILTGRTIDKTNEMLREWAGFSGLYARNADDMIWYYLVMHGANLHPYALFQAYHAVYQKLFQAFQARPAAERQQLDATMVNAAFAQLNRPPLRTMLAEQILEDAPADGALTVEGAADDAVFADIVDRLLPLMAGAYERLFARLKALCCCEPEQALYWESEKFLGTYQRSMERFRREQVLPKRSFLIALGIHLGLTVRGINDLLELANMGELNPRDKTECAVLFSLQAAYSRYPYVFHPDMQHEKDWLLGGGQTAAAQLSMSGLGDYSESLNEYIKRRLQEDGLQTDRLGAKEVEQFLQYL